MRNGLVVGVLLAAVGYTTGFVPYSLHGKANQVLNSSQSRVVVSLRRDGASIDTTPTPAAKTAKKVNTVSQSLERSSNELNMASLLSVASIPLAFFTALPANAADGTVVASAIAAYVHFAALLTCVGVLVTERLLVSPDMTFEEEELLWKVDALYGIAGLALAVSGYYRTVDYGKGWEFYAHEPLFWAKLVLVGIWGASSLFPTVTILKRVSVQRETGEYPPFSEKLAARMIQVINAELLAIASIPLMATLMSRGVLYGGGEFPWQVGAGLVVLTFGGAGFKYVKEALTWSEDEEDAVVPEE
jgi:uncharacterized membrane protein